MLLFFSPEGIERFKGQYFHSRQYKGPEGLEGKHILVVGIGNSAADIAVELSKKAAQVRCSLLTLSHRGEERGGHIEKSEPCNRGSIHSDWLVGWLASWLVGWLDGWFGGLVGWLVGRLFGWLADWLVG